MRSSKTRRRRLWVGLAALVLALATTLPLAVYAFSNKDVSLEFTGTNSFGNVLEFTVQKTGTAFDGLTGSGEYDGVPFTVTGYGWTPSSSSTQGIELNASGSVTQIVIGLNLVPIHLVVTPSTGGSVNFLAGDDAFGPLEVAVR